MSRRLLPLRFGLGLDLGLGLGSAVGFGKKNETIAALIRLIKNFIRVFVFGQKIEPTFVLRKNEELDPWKVAICESVNMRDVRKFNALIKAKNQEMISQQNQIIH